MKLFNKVAIIGVGLIGGSIGLCIKKRKLAREVIGISRHRRTIYLAKREGAIDRGCLNISVVKDADLVILAAPVSSIISIGIKVKSLIRSDTLVADTGSTKKIVVKTLEKAIPNFVGSHPLCGSEKQGVLNSDEDLFCGSLCVLTPTKKTSRIALSKIRRFWTQLGSRVIYLDPAVHDYFIASVSHLPHIVASSLIKSVPYKSFFLASSGLRDTTRIAASAPELWKDILLTNSKNVLRSLNRFERSLLSIKSAIIKKDAKTLLRILEQERLKRQSLENRR